MPTTRITAPQRLHEAIQKLINDLNDHISRIAQTNLKFGYCIIMPTHLKAAQITQAYFDEMLQEENEKYSKENIALFYGKFLPPPLIAMQKKNPEDPDYLVQGEVVGFDESYCIDLFAQGFLYCPSQKEMSAGMWHSRIRDERDAESITCLLDAMAKNATVRQAIGLFLDQDSSSFVKDFIEQYIKNDAEVGDEYKNIYQSELTSIIKKFEFEKKSILQSYLHAEKLKGRLRGQDERGLLKAYKEFIVQQCRNITIAMNTSDSVVDMIFHEITGGAFSKGKKDNYKANRPAMGVYYFRLAQFLYLLFLDFQKNPDHNQIAGQAVIFIWIAQTIAFEFPELKVQVKDILHIKTADLDLNTRALQIKGTTVGFTEGLARILESWLGKGRRKNARAIFSKLNEENLSAILERMGKELIWNERKILPKDLLIRSHSIFGYGMNKEVRQRLDVQEDLVSHSVYKTNPAEIKKHVLSAINKNQLKINSLSVFFS